MKSFLTQVAEALYSKYGRGIADVVMLFPSQRARLFFTQALSEVAEDAVWSPRYTTIEELMCQISTLRTADRIRLVSELYRVYSRFHSEDFDHFYHWGEMLIADFDMVDKYMVDAEALFCNIADIKDIEADLSYLTAEQEEYIRRFWNTLSSSMTLSEQKQFFLKIWHSLPQIYTQYKEHLRTLGIGYTGMIYRDAADSIRSATTSPLEPCHYAVAGFNALSSCEKILFDHLRSSHGADMFWDYNDYFFCNDMQEAGRFIRENVARYGESVAMNHKSFTKSISSLTVASTATSVAQCKYVAQMLESLVEYDEEGNRKPLGRDTAIVLTDESLLMPLLYALPDWVKRDGVNVTMGYPLRTTLAYSFVERLLELQSHARVKDGGVTFYHADIDFLLTHPYIADRDTEAIDSIRRQIVEHRIYNVPHAMVAGLQCAESIFRVADSAESLLQYLVDVFKWLLVQCSGEDVLKVEYLVQTVKGIEQLANMVSSCNIELTMPLMRSLVRRHLQSIRIPFEGEPLEGLQVMGILETRNIDFKNVIVLSMSDSNFPGTRIVDSSVIPYSLRYAYNLPTQEHHQGVYAYYFYRLISRAERVWLTYCSTADEKGTGEPSRYIRQLEYESGLKIESVKVGAEVNVAHQQPIEVAKDSMTLERLARYTTHERRLSPTAFSTYVQCPMRFFYRYMASIKVEDELEEGIDDKTFGNIFHRAAELLYGGIVGEDNPQRLLERIDNKAVAEAVDRAIAEVCFDRETVSEEQLQGELTIVRQIVTSYLWDNLLCYDKSHTGFSVMALEDVFDAEFGFTVAGERKSIVFEGRADRVDSLQSGVQRIIDYKTGGEHLTFPGFEKLFHGKDSQRISNTINTLLYAMIASRRRGCEVQPALYYLREMNRSDYSPLLRIFQGRGCPMMTIERYSDISEQFEGYVEDTLTEIFNPDIPFRQSEDPLSCTYCDYAPICARKRN